MNYITVKIEGGNLLIPTPQSYKDCIRLIQSDYYRIKGDKKSFLHILLRALIPYGNAFLFWFRLCQYRGWLYPICKMMWARSSRIHHIQIDPKVKIGFGFYIGHGMDIIINPTTIIGNNVNLSPFLNIGTNHGKAAVIGDNVYIGPHVSVVGEVHIENNSSIGAGAVVVKDVKENSTVAGVPAHELHKDNPGQFVNRRWPMEKYSL